MCCLVLPPEIVMHDAYIGGRFRRTKITRKARNAAENLKLYRFVQFFFPRSSCTTQLSADVQRITWNASLCIMIMISGGRTKQLDIIAGFLPRHWLYEWFSQFHSCGTYSVLSRNHWTVSFLVFVWAAYCYVMLCYVITRCVMPDPLRSPWDNLLWLMNCWFTRWNNVRALETFNFKKDNNKPLSAAALQSFLGLSHSKYRKTGHLNKS